MNSIQNKLLKITVHPIGAELCNISAINTGTEFMWDANPDIWGSFAPNLFPIIGGLKSGTYRYNDTTYSLPKHGFVRHNNAIQLTEATDTALTYTLEYDEASLKCYPFKFKFSITFALIDNTITVTHIVNNLDVTPLFFSVGGHPAFKCPVFPNETYSDYHLEFETPETAVTHLLNTSNGLVSNNTKPVLNNTTVLQLTPNLFDADALIFKDLKSRKVALKSKTHGCILTVAYPDFNYLGIWAKPNANFVCIEPWLGIADNEDTNQILETKEGILSLAPQNTFKASYTISIDKAHL